MTQTQRAADMTYLRELKARRRSLAQAMREQGIRRTSFMNGGLTDIEYRCNADIFDLETRIKREQANA